MPLKSLKWRARGEIHLLKKLNTVSFELWMHGNPSGNGGNTNTTFSSDSEMDKSMIRGITKMITKLPRDRSRRGKIKKDSRENISPNMIKLTKIRAPHEGRAIMCNLNEVMEKRLPETGKGLMEIGNGGIRLQIIKPDSAITEIEVPT